MVANKIYTNFNTLYESVFDEIDDALYKRVVIYPGRFHPFHRGHASVYFKIKELFPQDDIFIATSNKVDEISSPFTFDDKKTLMEYLGISTNDIFLTKVPYQPKEIISMYEESEIYLIFIISSKDMEDSPRFTFKPKKDGSSSYFQRYDKENLETADKHGYIKTIDTHTFKILGNDVKSASEIRSLYRSADTDHIRRQIITDLYGSYDMNIKEIFDNALLN